MAAPLRYSQADNSITTGETMSNTERDIDYKKLIVQSESDSARENTSLSEQIKVCQSEVEHALAQLVLAAAEVKRRVSPITTDTKFPIDASSIVALQNLISQIHDYNNKVLLTRGLSMAEEVRRARLSFLK